MFTLYKRLLPQMGGYLTQEGELHRGRLELFLSHLAREEADVLQARAEVRTGLFLLSASCTSTWGGVVWSCSCRPGTGGSSCAAGARRGGKRDCLFLFLSSLCLLLGVSRAALRTAGEGGGGRAAGTHGGEDGVHFFKVHLRSFHTGELQFFASSRPTDAPPRRPRKTPLSSLGPSAQEQTLLNCEQKVNLRFSCLPAHAPASASSDLLAGRRAV